MASGQLSRISDLIQDPQNPNRGSKRGREMVAQSLRRLGAGRSIVVDKRGRIIAGNKTAEAFQALGHEDVVLVKTTGDKLVVVQRDDLDLLDGTDKRARELSIVDNRAGELGLTWDTDVLKALSADGSVDLRQMWTEHELEGLFAADDQDEKPLNEREFDELPHELAGVAALKMDASFPSDLPYEIPPYRIDRLASMPTPIDTWAGPDASDPNWTGYWFFNYGRDSFRYLDGSRTVLGFYTEDFRFECWWDQPDVYVGRALNAGIQTAITPNFSVYWHMPKAVQIYQTFRSRWLGRYFQEAGMNVIPDLMWSKDITDEFLFLGIPKHAPCLAAQIQTVSTDAERDAIARSVAHTLDVVDPQSLLLYGGGKQTRDVIRRVLPNGLPVAWVESRASRRAKEVIATAPYQDRMAKRNRKGAAADAS